LGAAAAGDTVKLAGIPPDLHAHPAFAPYREAASLLATISGSPRLVPPLPRALGAVDFERRIMDADELTVRPGNLHDTVNAAVWRVFPRSKRAISGLHVTLGSAATANGRPRRRDVLTLFDEAGALILSQRDDLRGLHEQHAWRALFVERRAEFVRDCRVILFGHGTLEQIASNPHRGLTVKALWLPVSPDVELPQVDDMLATGIARGELLFEAERRLPLPILGVPGWFRASESPDCYADLDVFRPLRLHCGDKRDNLTMRAQPPAVATAEN